MSDPVQTGLIERMRSRLKGVVQLTRLDTALLAGVYTLLGSYLGGARIGELGTSPAIDAALVVMLIVAASFAINDIYDRENDAFFRPQRAIPSGRITVGQARWIALTFALAGLILSIRLGAGLFLFACFTLVLSTLYSIRLKGTPLWGNGAIALLDASILLFGAAAGWQLTPAVWTGFGLVFIFVLAQEILYTVHDEEGDRRMALATTAIAFGSRASIRMIQGLAALFMIVGLLPWFLGYASTGYLITIGVVSYLPLLYALFQLGIDPDRVALVRTARIFWLIRLTSLLPLVLLR